MSTEEGSAPQAKPAYIDQLKQLRQQRGPVPPEKLEEGKAQNRAQRAILKAIAVEARTVPEIAEETGLPSQEVFWWITALRKYNRVQDEGKRGDYVAYRTK
ncbi:MAG TPA: transcriptional regulator [Armatimonadota bacterium]|jgi:predicted Rossmann fold nucleotide-binding protein DprA/Smf involved in DNA uptake